MLFEGVESRSNHMESKPENIHTHSLEAHWKFQGGGGGGGL